MVKYIRQLVFGMIIAFVCLLGDIVSFAWMIGALIVQSPRFWNIALGKDQTFNAAIGGTHKETLSFRAAKAQLRGDKWGCILCKFLDYIEKDHCKITLEANDD